MKSKMMMLVVVAMGANLLLTGCGEEDKAAGSDPQGNPSPQVRSSSENASIYGKWGGFPEVSVGDDGKIGFVMELTADRIILHTTCRWGVAEKIEVQTSAPVAYTANTLQTMGEDRKTIRRNGRVCTGSINRNVVKYSLSGGLLTLSDDEVVVSLKRL